MSIYQDIENTRPDSEELVDKRCVWEPVGRVPFGLLQLIADNPVAGTWNFTTLKGSHIKAIKVPNANAIDFWMEMPR